MSLQKLTAALASGNAELQVALASMNLDISLIKMEAPKEYQPLALALPSRRKAEAEEGSTHAVARKLQALFSGLYMPTPALYTAYGSRASKITETQRRHAKTVDKRGPFAEHIGIEGGSIWAAATSGTNAIAIHLLACMLARIFTAPEAIAAWEEIVTIRKKQILDGSESAGVDQMFSILAAKSALSRQDLAEWDASARAWLRTADETMATKQKQLLLIINNNKKVPVNLHGSTFESVVQAWSRSMIAVEKLIQGMPHSIVDGSVLLALSSWHLYPDMSVLGEKNTFVKQADGLVKEGGVLTLGLETAIERYDARSSEGVTWSMPLAFYHYYGVPLAAERSLAVDGSRLTITQLQLVTAGSLFTGWIQRTSTAKQLSGLLVKVCSYLLQSATHKADGRYQAPSGSSWPMLVRKAAQYLLQTSGIDHEEACRLFTYGMRRGGAFLGLQEDKKPLMTILQQPKVLLPTLRTADSRIRLLRQLALRMKVEPGRLVIRYALTGLREKQGTMRFGYASINATMGGVASDRKLARWQVRHAAGPPYLQAGEMMFELDEHQIVRGPVQADVRFFWCEAPQDLQSEGITSVTVDGFFGQYAEHAIYRRRPDPRNPKILDGVPFHFVIGDPNTAAIYEAYEKTVRQPGPFYAEELVRPFDEGEVQADALMSHFTGIVRRAKQKAVWTEHHLSLKAVATISAVYEHLPGASIPLSILKCSVANAKWLPDNRNDLEKAMQAGPAVAQALTFEPCFLDRPSTFACIAMMETGTVNIGPDGLRSVMAMSSGDSLFLASPIINDPALRLNVLVTRVRGSIGRAGICFMIPPAQIMPAEGTDDWNLIDHAGFDGTLKDAFRGTSLHLSFTEFTLAVDTGSRGLRTSEVFLLETVLSVHDKGRRVADLDILAAHESRLLRIVSEAERCVHTQDENEKPGPCSAPLLSGRSNPGQGRQLEADTAAGAEKDESTDDDSVTSDNLQRQIEELREETENDRMTALKTTGPPSVVASNPDRKRPFGPPCETEHALGPSEIGQAVDTNLLKRHHKVTHLDDSVDQELNNTSDEEWILDGANSIEDQPVSVDSWPEFLDQPHSTGVVRAHGNWQARLAAASLSVARGQLTLVFGDHVCWECARAERHRFGHKRKAMFVL